MLAGLILLKKEMGMLRQEIRFFIIIILMNCLFLSGSNAQEKKSLWSLQDCIKYALEKNIDVQKTELTNLKNAYSQEYSKAERFPTLSGSVGQNLAWSKSVATINEYGNYTNSGNTNYSINSNVVLYNVNKVNNNIKLSGLNHQAGKYDSETTKETISLNVLNAYLQVLYAEEQVNNTIKQIESTTEQLHLADERLRLNSISRSDYLQVKSQLASEKLTLANAHTTLAIDRVSLMQLLELPVNDKFSILHPSFNDSIDQKRNPDAEAIYLTSIGIKPQIKSSETKTEIAKLDVKLAKADYYPSLSMNAGISSSVNNQNSNISFVNQVNNISYSNQSDNLSYVNQFKNNITPALGLSLSIPINQNKKIYTNVKLAEIDKQNADLTLQDTKNQLRKSIEQSCTDVTSAEAEYEAAMEQYEAANESYLVAKERFEQGMINFVDFLIQKTNFISSESSLLQSKYKLIFSYKKLDFYSGKQLDI